MMNLPWLAFSVIIPLLMDGPGSGLLRPIPSHC
jgi:hypothetical protein